MITNLRGTTESKTRQMLSFVKRLGRFRTITAVRVSSPLFTLSISTSSLSVLGPFRFLFSGFLFLEVSGWYSNLSKGWVFVGA